MSTRSCQGQMFFCFVFSYDFAWQGKHFLSAFVYFAHCLSLGYEVQPLHVFKGNNSSPKNSFPKCYCVSKLLTLCLLYLSERRVCLVCHVVCSRNLHLISFYYLCNLVLIQTLFFYCPFFCPVLTFSLCLSFFLYTVQSHKVCWEPAGDDQLSHGMLSCETGCIVFLLSPLYSWVTTKLSWTDGLEQLFNCQEFLFAAGKDRSRLQDRGNGSVKGWLLVGKREVLKKHFIED